MTTELSVHWKQQFIFFLPKVGTNLPQFMEDELKQDRTRKQPFVLAFGDRRYPTQSFVIIEGVALPATDLIAAFDICFKSLYLFDIAYPCQCQTTWEFIHKFLFKLSEGKGKVSTSPSVRSLHAFLSSQ